MRIGGGEKWLPSMLRVDESFMQVVGEVWERCREPFGSDSREDDITNRLVALLQRMRRNPPPYRVMLQTLDVQLDADDKATITGRHDIHLVFDLNDEDASLIYECKRLNVVKNGKKSGLATEYVTEGMMRFVTCQYSKQLRRGGMLGYVMNGELDDAVAKVRQAIDKHAYDLALDGKPTAVAHVSPGARFASNHCRNSCASPFRIQHQLLPL